MYFIQIFSSGTSIGSVILGTFIMLLLSFAVVGIVALYLRRMKRLNLKFKELEEQQQIQLLQASIKFQEEERNRIAADLHDDAGPLLATVRLYLNDGFVNQDKAYQLQAIYSAKQIIDEAIGLIRNISHRLMPPTLRNFGLDSAATDLFNKINGSGVIKTSAKFHDYKDRLTPENEMLAFRVIQELVNNILKHSNAGFIHLAQTLQDENMYIRLQHDGKGITQTEFEHLSFSGNGLGLKNINSRMRVLKGRILYEQDISQTFYRITMVLPNSPHSKADDKVTLV